jgi:hypothetical protein
MWQRLISFASIIAVTALCTTASGEGPQKPYGPYDAIAEGTRNSEAQRLSLIDSQLDQMDRLRSLTVPVVGGRFLLGEPGVVGVYRYGRRGLLGIRPQCYIVLRRAPSVEYGRVYAPPPPPAEPTIDFYGNSPRVSVRQPIGHESLQTAPDRWEYRPLYADDERFDAMHREIERNLRLPEDDIATDIGGFSRNPSSRAAFDQQEAEPEELPEPRRSNFPDVRHDAVGRGEARDIARQTRPNHGNDNAPQTRDDVSPRRTTVPPPPRPDPPEQPASRVRLDNAEPKRAKSPEQGKQPSNEPLRGPLLRNPATGTREF